MSEEDRPPVKLPQALVQAYRECIQGRDDKIRGLDQERLRLEGQKAELYRENTDLRTQIGNLKSKDLAAIVQGMTSVWLRPRGERREPEVAFRDDPVYGQFFLDPRLYPVFFHPLFQRLSYIRQLSFAYLVFPSASHTRLSHCLGVAKNAQKAMRAIYDRGCVYRHKGRRRIELDPVKWESLSLKAQLCGLLHDVGHGPFGHALDKLIPYLDPVSRMDVPDKVYSLRYTLDQLKEAVSEVGARAEFDPRDVSAILDKERQADLTGYDKLIASVIDSQLDVDAMDFLERDGHMTGIGAGHANVEALIEHMCPFEDDRGRILLTYEESALSHIENFLYAHDMMYINCYEHPRKLAGERLLIRLSQHLLDQGIGKDVLMLLTDEQLLSTLNWFLPENGALRECLRAIQENYSFQSVSDHPVVKCDPVSERKVLYKRGEYPVYKWDPNKNLTVFNDDLNDEIKGWAKRKAGREEHLKYVFIDAPNNWEDRICRLAGVGEGERWKVLVTVPGYEARQRQESNAQVLIKSGPSEYETVELFEASSLMRAVITNLMPLRQVIRVLVSEDLPPAAAETVASAADDVFLKGRSAG
jgi:HD superfamily phosphohydrolase